MFPNPNEPGVGADPPVGAPEAGAPNMNVFVPLVGAAEPNFIPVSLDVPGVPNEKLGFAPSVEFEPIAFDALFDVGLELNENAGCVVVDGILLADTPPFEPNDDGI